MNVLKLNKKTVKPLIKKMNKSKFNIDNNLLLLNDVTHRFNYN